jgi:hypothetical protein
MTIKVGSTGLQYIKSVLVIELPRHFAANGDLVVMERVSHIPFVIARVFVVLAPVGAIRGQHAHKQCAQFLTCPAGRVDVLCDDGVEKVTHVLDQPGIGLLIPPSIWAQQTYQVAGSLLTVLCDRPYEAEDYIRDYEEFLAYRMIS